MKQNAKAQSQEHVATLRFSKKANMARMERRTGEQEAVITREANTQDLRDRSKKLDFTCTLEQK